VIDFNGTAYCSSDVSKDVVVGSPGYSYFLNSSVAFMGVVFQTLCPANYSGCPGSSGNSTATVLYAGAMKAVVTFPDKSNETIGGVVGDSDQALFLSAHADPRAGIEIQYVPGLYASGASTSNYRVLLLVQAPPAQ
jgi:hypothetical protein